MIFDRIENRKLYTRLGDGIAMALEALTTDLPARADGRYELRGDRVFAMVQSYETIPAEQAVWEAHRKYIDVQYMVEGAESMGHLPIDGLKVKQPYDVEKDFELFDAPASQGNRIIVPAGSFAIFYPSDVHMPKLPANGKVGWIKKVVVKVAVG
jgi:YhcH/YjgK/YiaL family protein